MAFFVRVARLWTLPGGPWWHDGASLSLDWRNNRYMASDVRFASFPDIPNASITNSNGTIVDVSGNIVTVADNTVRLDYFTDARRLLVEEARTNIALRSEEFDNATWVSTNGAVTGNDITSPSGAVTADRKDKDTTSAHLYQGSITVTASTVYEFSFYAKAGTSTTIHPRFFDESNSAFFGTNAQITITGAWVRYTYSLTTPIGCTSLRVYVTRDDSNTGSFYIWGSQVEAGSFLTSYIPTTTTAVTRTADVIKITGLDTAAWFDKDTFTYFIKYELESAAHDVGHGLSIYNSAAATQDRHRLESGTPTGGGVVSDGSTYSRAANSNLSKRIALACALNDVTHSHNGAAAPAPDTSFTPPPIDTLYIGDHPAGVDTLNGRIEIIEIFPLRQNDARLQALTA